MSPERGPAAGLALGLARAADAPRIARIARDHVEYGLPWTWTAERVLGAIRHPERTVLCARRGERTVAFAIMSFGPAEAHLDLLAVLPRYRRQGLATRMLGWLEDSARTAGIARVRLELRVDNAPARACYARLGYRPAERLPGYYSRLEPALRMVHELHGRTPPPLAPWRPGGVVSEDRS